jgi:hypothetical protein
MDMNLHIFILSHNWQKTQGRECSEKDQTFCENLYYSSCNTRASKYSQMKLRVHHCASYDKILKKRSMLDTFGWYFLKEYLFIEAGIFFVENVLSFLKTVGPHLEQKCLRYMRKMYQIQPPFGRAPLQLRLRLLRRSPTKRFSRRSRLEPFFSEKKGRSHSHFGGATPKPASTPSEKPLEMSPTKQGLKWKISRLEISVLAPQEKI